MDYKEITITLKAATRDDLADEIEYIADEVRSGATGGIVRIGGEELGEWRVEDPDVDEDFDSV